MKPKNSSIFLLITICIIIGIAFGGAIAKKKNNDVNNAIDILNNAADYYDTSAYSVAAGIGDIEAQNNIHIGYVIGGIGGLFLGLLISQVLTTGKEKNIIEHKDDLMDTNINSKNEINNLVKFTENQAVKNMQTKPLSTKAANILPSIASLLRRAEIFLEDGEFNSAEEYFNRVLDMNPECAKAYIGRLLVELKLKSEDELASCEVDITKYGNYSKAVRFADETYKRILNDYKQCIYLDAARNEK